VPQPHDEALQIGPLAPVGGASHGVLHAPQWSASSAVFVSQPLLSLPSQSVHGALHTLLQDPFVHVAVAFSRTGQALSHPPQCFGSLDVSTHVPEHAV
jgi:hypothetical protein